MNRMIKSGLYAVVFGLAFVAMGCSSTSYYKITDPASGNVYYTSDIKSDKNVGSVKFLDERSKSVVTLQNSEIKEISDEEYKAAMSAPKTTPAEKPATTAPESTPTDKPAEGSQPQ